LGEDLRAARALYPDAAVFAVNRAAGAVRSSHVFTLHPERAGQWRGLARHYWSSRITLHAGAIGKGGTEHPGIDHWWQGMNVWRNSGCAAAVWALMAGADLAIMAGIGGQADGYFATVGGPGDDVWRGRKGEKNARDLRVAAGNIAESSYGRLVFSMSGATREIFGPPPRLRE